MSNLEAVSDAYIWGLTEQGFEPEVEAYCQYCNNELYSGEDVVADDCGNYFCDLECARDYLGIKEAYSVEETMCFCCGADLLADEYEVYEDRDNCYYCSQDCAEQENGIKSEIL